MNGVATGQADSPVIRKARMTDIAPLLELINGYADMGIMLPRSEVELAEGIRDFTVAACAGRLVACGALHFYSPATAEVRSLAVHPLWKSHGVGRRLVEALEQEAVEHGLGFVFAFTYVPGFFQKLGFVEVDRAELPSKVWKDCLRCPKFQCCDELAMVKYLHEKDIVAQAIRRETAVERSDPESTFIHLPVLKH